MAGLGGRQCFIAVGNDGSGCNRSVVHARLITDDQFSRDTVNFGQMTRATVDWNRYGGVAIAAVGFVLTRQFVAQTIQVEHTLSFLLLSLAPLAVGLGLSLYGVILAVGQFSPGYARTVTIWCGLGTVGAAGLIAATQLEAMTVGGMVEPLDGTQPLVANLLLGGAVGGMLIGDRSAANRRKRRELQRTANRAALVNRLLRHDVINAAAIIDGHAALLKDQPERRQSVAAVDNAATKITDTIEAVGRIASPHVDSALTTVKLHPVITEVVDDYRASTDREISLSPFERGATVAADDRLEMVLGELIDNAIEHGEGPIAVSVASARRAVEIRIEDGGDGLPDRQRELLESGTFPEYDDPDAGFGLQVVSLLVDRYGGRITTGADGGRHHVTIRLPASPTGRRVTDRIGLAQPTIMRAGVAGVFAGAVMGGLYQFSTGTMPVIGALYGVEHAGIGWITHLFHSVIFALLFATGCRTTAISQYVSTPSKAALAGVGWGGVLWLVAAGVVMPLWLLAVGEPATVPTLEASGLFAHVLWGLVLGGSFALLAASQRVDQLVGAVSYTST